MKTGTGHVPEDAHRPVPVSGAHRPSRANVTCPRLNSIAEERCGIWGNRVNSLCSAGSKLEDAVEFAMINGAGHVPKDVQRPVPVSGAHRPSRANVTCPR